MEHYVAAFKQFADFKSRSTRTQYWYFFLFNLIINIVLQVIDGVVFGQPALAGLYGLVIMIPNIAYAARRLHDMGKSGWWQLLALTCIGLPVVIYWLCQPSNEGDNAFGPDPWK